MNPGIGRELTMPIFEYVCGKCNHEFEALVYGSQKAECPKCHGKKLKTQLSVFAVSGKGMSSSPAPSGGACGSCGDPRGPGSCSMPDLD
jgi:putative FmdB family regulatory protein